MNCHAKGVETMSDDTKQPEQPMSYDTNRKLSQKRPIDEVVDSLTLWSRLFPKYALPGTLDEEQTADVLPFSGRGEARGNAESQVFMLEAAAPRPDSVPSLPSTPVYSQTEEFQLSYKADKALRVIGVSLRAVGSARYEHRGKTICFELRNQDTGFEFGLEATLDVSGRASLCLPDTIEMRQALVGHRVHLHFVGEQ